MKIKEKIGVIGIGNMGAAILEGLFKKNLAAPSQVFVFDKISEKTEEFVKHWKTQRADSNAGLVKQVEIILLAVKPQDLSATAAEFEQALTKSHTLISILAGTPLVKIRQVAGSTVQLVRAMPNLGARVGEAVTALAGSSPESLGLAEKIFSGCGKTIRMDEKYFDLVTAVSGSGPAYFFFLMELLAAEGIRNGLSKKEAELLAVQTAVGAGLLAQAASESPEELRKKVTSKGGTTEAALKILLEKKFPEIFHDAIQAALNRGRELSQQ